MNTGIQAFLRDPAVLERNMGVETILYTNEMHAIHVLNGSAKLIWDLCDGGHTLAEIEHTVRARFAVGESVDLYLDIGQAIEALLKKGLVVVVDRAR